MSCARYTAAVGPAVRASAGEAEPYGLGLSTACMTAPMPSPTPRHRRRLRAGAPCASTALPHNTASGAAFSGDAASAVCTRRASAFARRTMECHAVFSANATSARASRSCRSTRASSRCASTSCRRCIASCFRRSRSASSASRVRSGGSVRASELAVRRRGGDDREALALEAGLLLSESMAPWCRGRGFASYTAASAGKVGSSSGALRRRGCWRSLRFMLADAGMVDTIGRLVRARSA
mmetsp:Transcript_34101/g.105371  ORF Transcript_34101/g.105371 Transcript_34101/m.105371 type:complete len:238 (-) Transcript_34101:173-886(-)